MPHNVKSPSATVRIASTCHAQPIRSSKQVVQGATHHVQLGLDVGRERNLKDQLYDQHDLRIDRSVSREH
jgi:hypothetical protein